MTQSSSSFDPNMVLDFTRGGLLPAPALRELDRIAEKQRDAFSALIAELSRGRERNIDWWVSRAASRNTHMSSLFTQCMQLALVRTLLDAGIRPSVKVNDHEMAAILRSVLGEARVVFVGGGRLRRLRAAIWDIGSSIFHSSASSLAAWRTRRERKPIPDLPISVLETFVYRDSLSEDGGFKDFHYPTLYESLSEEQRRRLYYLPLFYRLKNYTPYFLKLRRSKCNFLPREDYLRWADYFFAFMHWWRIIRLKGRAVRFAGFDVGLLVDAELEAGRFANSAIQALLNYRFWALNRSGLAIHRYIDWYEGHDIDHAVAAAINWHARSPELIAFRPIAPGSYLSVTPTPHEFACGVVASVWGIIGSRVRHEISQIDSHVQVYPAPGLRHRRLCQFERRPPLDGRKTILVLFSQEMDLTSRLLTTVGPLLGKNSGYRWLIKRHPGMPRAKAEAAVSTYSRDAELVEGDFFEYLAQASVVIGLGSNTLIEAVAAGVPTICASSGNEPTEVPFSSSFKLGWWSVCYDSAELAALIPLAIEASETQAPSQDLKEALLGPFDVSVMHALLFSPLQPIDAVGGGARYSPS